MRAPTTTAPTATMTKRTSDRSTLTAEEVGKKHGFRSGLEDGVAAELRERGVPVVYEQHAIEYTVPSRKARYTPDFLRPNGIWVETKGRFVTADRQKHKLIKAEHPDIEIRFVFQNPNARISKKSRTTYAMWCEKYGFQWAKAPTAKQRQKGAHAIPQEWLDE